MITLRRRLLLALLPAIALIWLLVSAIEGTEVRHELEETHDAQLARVAEVLATLVEATLEQSAPIALGRWEAILRRSLEERGWQVDLTPHSKRGVDEVENLAVFQIWRAGDDLIARSATAPAVRLTDNSVGYHDVVVDGVDWHTFTLVNPRHDFTVIVADAGRVRDEAVQSVLAALAIPFVIGLPLVALLVWIAVGRSLRPLTAIGAQIAQRSEDNLETIDDASAPLELRPVMESLNRLLTRLRYALERERRFTADASHELRTPLAAVRTQAQVAMRSRNEQERMHALRQVVAGVDRTTHLVGQLLALARWDSEGAAAGDGADLGEICARVVEAFHGRDHPLVLHTAGGALPAPIGADALELMVRNLVDNAIRYSPAGSLVEVSVGRDRDGVFLAVADQGPGIAADERERVFERFYRGQGVDTPGTGLGLSIVRRLADAHGASVELRNRPAGGLEARVRFAPPGSPGPGGPG